MFLWALDWRENKRKRENLKSLRVKPMCPNGFVFVFCPYRPKSYTAAPLLCSFMLCNHFSLKLSQPLLFLYRRTLCLKATPKNCLLAGFKPICVQASVQAPAFRLRGMQVSLLAFYYVHFPFIQAVGERLGHLSEEHSSVMGVIPPLSLILTLVSFVHSSIHKNVSIISGVFHRTAHLLPWVTGCPQGKRIVPVSQDKQAKLIWLK